VDNTVAARLPRDGWSSSTRAATQGPSGGDQELSIALGPRDRALHDPQHPPALLVGEPARDVVADHLVQRRIAYHAALADLTLADLELRFDQRHQPGVRRGEGERRRERQLQRDEAHIRDHHFDLLRDLGAGEAARILPLQHVHARIVAQPPVELAVADVDGKDTPGAAPQQHVGKAAGRGADVERAHAGRIEAKMVEGVGELDAATRDVRLLVLAQREREVGSDLLTRLVETAFARKDPAGENQRLGSGAAQGQPALDQQLIEPGLPARAADSQLRRAPASGRPWRSGPGSAGRVLRCAWR
jgi:hypothetical protein